MSTETIVETDDLSLDDFSAEFFGQNKTEPEPASSEATEKESQESDAETTEDTHEDSDDSNEAVTDDDDENDTETEEAEEAPKPKKNRFQERIDEVVAKQREAERKLEAALSELQKLQQNKDPDPAPKAEKEDGPKPTDLNEDGTEKYPLGEFDPNYFRDLMKHTFEVEERAREESRQQQAQQQALEAQKEELQKSWNEKLAPAQERYPDFQEKGEQLLSTFEGIDAAYGEYLSQTLMSMEYGPDVLYYLANHPDEASKIVNSGPQRATVALGRLEAKFADAEAEKQLARPKPSKAPEPPQIVNKGSVVAKPTIRGDEDDLELVSAALFKRR